MLFTLANIICIIPFILSHNLANSLISYAGIQKECAIIGVNDRLEIWALDKFNNLMEENTDSLSDIAENLFEGEFDA